MEVSVPLQACLPSGKGNIGVLFAKSDQPFSKTYPTTFAVVQKIGFDLVKHIAKTVSDIYIYIALHSRKWPMFREK